MVTTLALHPLGGQPAQFRVEQLDQVIRGFRLPAPKIRHELTNGRRVFPRIGHIRRF